MFKDAIASVLDVIRSNTYSNLSAEMDPLNSINFKEHYLVILKLPRTQAIQNTENLQSSLSPVLFVITHRKSKIHQQLY